MHTFLPVEELQFHVQYLSFGQLLQDRPADTSNQYCCLTRTALFLADSTSSLTSAFGQLDGIESFRTMDQRVLNPGIAH